MRQLNHPDEIKVEAVKSIVELDYPMVQLAKRRSAKVGVCSGSILAATVGVAILWRDSRTSID